jgi:hypothetical protein
VPPTVAAAEAGTRRALGVSPGSGARTHVVATGHEVVHQVTAQETATAGHCACAQSVVKISVQCPRTAVREVSRALRRTQHAVADSHGLSLDQRLVAQLQVRARPLHRCRRWRLRHDAVREASQGTQETRSTEARLAAAQRSECAG